MKLQDQVCNLELSKRLKELGVKQESLFGWRKGGIEPKGWIVVSTFSDGQYLAAFTVAELGEMLPRIHFQQGRTYKLVCFKEIRNDNEEWRCRYECESNNGYHQQIADTEADARAKMLIYLLENKLMSAITS